MKGLCHVELAETSPNRASHRRVGNGFEGVIVARYRNPLFRPPLRLFSAYSCSFRSTRTATRTV